MSERTLIVVKHCVCDAVADVGASGEKGGNQYTMLYTFYLGLPLKCVGFVCLGNIFCVVGVG